MLYVALMRRGIVAILIASVALAMGACAGERGAPRFQVMMADGKVEAAPGDQFSTSITIVIPKGFYLKSDALRIDTPQVMGVVFDEVVPPPPTEMLDVVGHPTPVYRGEIGVPITGRATVGAPIGVRNIKLDVSYQGCSEKLCLRPSTEETSFELAVGRVSRAPAVVRKPAAQGTVRTLLSAANFEHILDRGLLWTVLIVFIAGLIAALTPCIWPLIPVMLVIIGVERQHSFVRNFLLAASMVTGLVIVYAAMGVGAVALGKNLGFIFQQRWFLFAISGFFILMALGMFGVFHIHISRRWEHLLHALGGKGFRGAFLSGLGLGLIASPCTGPVIAGLLGYVAFQANYLLGFCLLVVFGLGMGLVFILLGAGYGVLVDHVRSGGWMNWMKRALGLVLLIPAAFYLSTALGMAGREPPARGPHVAWIENLDHAMDFAKENERPIMLDFSAEWCAPCRTLERTFFRRPEIVRLSMQMVPVRIDSTYESKELRELMDEYCVMGFPAILFLAPDGVPYNDLRVGFVNRKLLEENMREAIRRVTDRVKPTGDGECESSTNSRQETDGPPLDLWRVNGQAGQEAEADGS
jgi:thiol:disulfide interchange protein DsbD